MNIYQSCPEVRGERFCLRFVTQEDCEDLLKVYSDVKSVPLFNGDNCNGDDFHYTTLERMRQAMTFWIWSYENGWFVRLSIQYVAAGVKYFGESQLSKAILEIRFFLVLLHAFKLGLKSSVDVTEIAIRTV